MIKLNGAVSHQDREVAELRGDRELAVEYLIAAVAEIEYPEGRGAFRLALRTLAAAYGRLGPALARSAVEFSEH